MTSPSSHIEAIAEQLKDACLLVVAMDCSTKSRAREIRRETPNRVPLPKPLRSEEHLEGLPRSPCKISGGYPKIILHVRSSLTRCNPWWIGVGRPSARIPLIAYIGTFTKEGVREFLGAQYDSCCWGRARCKNSEEVTIGLRLAAITLTTRRSGSRCFTRGRSGIHPGG